MASPFPPGGPPTIPHDVQVKQKQGQATMIWAIGALVDLLFEGVSEYETTIHSFCIFGWEWLLCLPQEYERIWKRPINVSNREAYCCLDADYFCSLQAYYI
jgi:hypothetical protein